MARKCIVGDSAVADWKAHYSALAYVGYSSAIILKVISHQDTLQTQPKSLGSM